MSRRGLWFWSWRNRRARRGTCPSLENSTPGTRATSWPRWRRPSMQWIRTNWRSISQWRWWPRASWTSIRSCSISPSSRWRAHLSGTMMLRCTALKTAPPARSWASFIWIFSPGEHSYLYFTDFFSGDHAGGSECFSQTGIQGPESRKHS